MRRHGHRCSSPRRHAREEAFTLVEILVVVIVIGILAAIAIPRFLSQREEANDATAVSDLRNLIVIETSLEAGSGLTDDPDVVEAEGWEGSSPRVRVCAELLAGGADVTLTAWHLDGSRVYSYTRSVATVVSNEVSLEATCAAQVGTGATTVWPSP